MIAYPAIGRLYLLDVRVAVDIAEEEKSDHELGVFSRSAEVLGVSVFDKVFYEGEVYDFVYFT